MVDAGAEEDHVVVALLGQALPGLEVIDQAHLLLGGDTLVMTLSWRVESKPNTKLSLRQRRAMRRQSSGAKERLLASQLESAELQALGRRAETGRSTCRDSGAI